MDLPSPVLSDKLGILSRNDSTVNKEDPMHVIPSDTSESLDSMVQRCVIIQKDEKGYGLTVSGDNPVFVQSVKEDGAAARAGVQQGDRIIKVNGTLVTQSNHQEVVERIKSGTYVALTLLGKPPGHAKGSLSPQQSFHVTGNNSNLHILNSNKVGSSDRITGPQPVDPEKQQQLTNSRIHTIRKMLEKEIVYLENLRTEFLKTPSDKIRSELNGATKRVKTLEDQLFSLTGIPHEQIIAKSPKSPTSGRHNHEKENYRSVSFPMPGHHSRSLTHQVSAPLLPASQEKLQHPVSPSSDTSDSKYNVTLLPYNEQQDQQREISDAHTDVQKQSISTSLENIVKHLSPRSTTWPQASHTRQSSSPESLVHGIENIKCQKNSSSSIPKPESLFRSPSSVSSCYSGSKSFVSDSDLKSGYTTTTSRGSSIGQYDSAVESPVPSPPVTPPEPAEAKSISDRTDADDPMLHEEYGTPPESSMEVNIQSVISKLGHNPSIICMEDDDFSSDTEVGIVEDHGPFNGIWKLVRNPAHLAVFIHYLMSNSDPSSLFFYLITDMYEQGNGKEMKKWAYEIHSSFLVPGAPLKVSLVDETILHEIDDVLLNHTEKEEVLRTVFRKARKKAKVELNDLLADFRNKRTMGLANIFGPPDYQLEEALHDKNKELKIIEQLLVPCLETFSVNFREDVENVDDRSAAKALALATILKQFGVKSQQTLNLLDRCPTFVAKDKSRLRFLQRNKKVMFIQGHHFVPEHYYCVTFCNHCQLIIWGVGNQGYQCQNCEMNVHKCCVKVVEEHCIGALRNKKDKKRDRKSGIMENIIGKTRKPSQPVPAAIEKAKRLNEELNADNGFSQAHPEAYHSDILSDSADRSTEEIKDPSDVMFQNMLNLSESFEKQNSSKRSTSSSIGRSESFRQRRQNKPSFRKRSDPNIPRSKSDVEVDDRHGLNQESRSSSNSSLSNRSLDSPSNSSEMVHRTPTLASADSVPSSSSCAPDFHNVTSGVHNTTASIPGVHNTVTGASSVHNTSGSISGVHNAVSAHSATASHVYDDSDLEAEADPPNWQENVDWEIIRLMKPKEKKRQDVINELFHTERTHVRNLKVLDRLFYKPMLQEQLLPPDFMNLLFPNLEEVLEIHNNFNKKMKARRKTEPVIGDIGHLMLEMFDGDAGEHLKQAAAKYCQNQSIALEGLKMRQKKDQKLAQSLAEAELNNLCRRLQLKDIIASGFQRLTKYPLLLENVTKYTAPNAQEELDLRRAIECSKDILVHVNSAINEAENMHRLLDIQRKLEKSAFEKVDHTIVRNFKNLDVTKHRLIHEGPLAWRLNRQKTIDMHVVLLEDILILFQKQDDKYILKFHNTNLTICREETKIMHSPILRVHNLLIRDNATDKKSIFLISPLEMHAMYEFVAGTTSEKNLWFQHLTKAVEHMKMVQKNLAQEKKESSEDGNEPPIAAEENAEESEVETKCDEISVNANQGTNTQQTAEAETSQPAIKCDASADVSSDDIPQKTKSINVEEQISKAERETGAEKRIHQIKISEITEDLELIEPSEVVINGAVCGTAEPVVTPLEKLRRKNCDVEHAIQDKEQILADIFNLPLHDFKNLPEITDDTKEFSASELIMSAVQQASKLTSLVNDGMNVCENDPSNFNSNDVPLEQGSSPELQHLDQTSSDLNNYYKIQGIPYHNLVEITTRLNKSLVQLMGLITNMEEERKQLRKELTNSREQLHQLHETHRHCVIQSQSPSTHSRPSSFVSVASTISDSIAEFFEHPQLFSVSEKSEEVALSEGEVDQNTLPSNVTSSSPVNGNCLSTEVWSDDKTNELPATEMTCEQTASASNCDSQDSGTDTCVNESTTVSEPAMDLICRTEQEPCELNETCI